MSVCVCEKREKQTSASIGFIARFKKTLKRLFGFSKIQFWSELLLSHRVVFAEKKDIKRFLSLSLSRRRRQDRIRASRASSLLRSRDDDDEKFLARKKTKERSERRHMRDLEDIKKERKRYTSIDVAVFSTFKAPYRSGHSSSSSAVLLFCSTIMFYKLLLLFCCS